MLHLGYTQLAALSNVHSGELRLTGLFAALQNVPAILPAYNLHQAWRSAFL